MGCILFPTQDISEYEKRNGKFYFWWMNFNVHLLVPLFIIGEFAFFTNVQFVFQHYRFVLTLLLLYLFCINLPVSLLYYPPYPILTWRDMRTPVLIIGGILVHFGAWVCICRIRRRTLERTLQKCEKPEATTIGNAVVVP